MRVPGITRAFRESLPSRGAWIEIPARIDEELQFDVAPLTGSVD